MDKIMKAWLVREKDEFCATVVFAETRGKAKALALQTEACDGADFLDIEVLRMKAADKYYKDGKKELDWLNPSDRIALVKDCGFTCDWDSIELKECVDCAAKEYCDQYKDLLKKARSDNG